IHMSEETEPKKKPTIWTTAKIMSTSALFISVISLIALLYQSYLAREENKLIRKQQSATVLPYLSTWFSNSSKGFKIVLGNKGVGPAFIKTVNLVYDDSLKFDNSDDLMDHIFMTTKGLDTMPRSTSTLSEGLVLPANETVEVVWVRDKTGVLLFTNALDEKNLEYEIFYEDVYGAQWMLSNKDDLETPIPVSKD
ncbi:MAG: hypothetical protein AAF901_02725, partial [Bacteroidota bacterium]